MCRANATVTTIHMRLYCGHCVRLLYFINGKLHELGHITAKRSPLKMENTKFHSVCSSLLFYLIQSGISFIHVFLHFTAGLTKFTFIWICDWLARRKEIRKNDVCMGAIVPFADASLDQRTALCVCGVCAPCRGYIVKWHALGHLMNIFCFGILSISFSSLFLVSPSQRVRVFWLDSYLLYVQRGFYCYAIWPGARSKWKLFLFFSFYFCLLSLAM